MMNNFLVFRVDRYYFYGMALMLLIASHGTVGESESCPCFCDSSNRMNCASQKWKSIPKSIPQFVTVINFQVNEVNEIKANTFIGLKELTVLRLDNNKIKKIEPGAFNGAPKLNQLLLNNNDIQNFDASMLDGASPLKEGISLRSNKLKTFPLNVLKKYKVPINVDDNKIKCDCFSVIPNALKSLVFGTCHSPGKVKGLPLRSLSYGDVKCDECANNRCVHGSCYTKGKKALCSCFPGYTGELCQIGAVVTTAKSTTTATSGATTNRTAAPAPTPVTTTQTTFIATTATTLKTTKLKTERPKISTTTKEKIKTRKHTFQLLSDIRIKQKGAKTGGDLVLEGCRFKAPQNLPSPDGFTVGYLKDNWKFIELSKGVKGHNPRDLLPLVVVRTNASHSGNYKCIVKYANGTVVDIGSEPVHVGFDDVSETKFKLATKQNQDIKEKVLQLLTHIGLKNDTVTVEQPRTRLIFGTTGYLYFRVLQSNIESNEERLQFCLSMRTLGKMFDLKSGEDITPMDCCVSSEKSENALVGDKIEHKCPDSRRTVERKCQLDPVTGPYWTAKSPCPTKPAKKPHPGKVELKGLEKKTICNNDNKGRKTSSSPNEAHNEKCVTVGEKAEKFKMVVSKGQAVRDVEDVNLSAQILDDISKNLESNNIGNKTKQIKAKVVSDTVAAVNNIMKVNERVLAKAQISKNTSTKIVRSLERMSQSVAKDLNETNTSFEIADTNIAMTVFLVKPTQRRQHVSVVAYRGNENGSETRVGIYNDYHDSIDNNTAINGLITLPTDMIFAGNRTPVVSSISYSSDVFFLTGKQLEEITSGDGKTQKVKKAVGSSVLSASIGDEEFTSLTTPVTISFRNPPQSLGTGIIKFWEFQNDGWSFKGCWPLNDTSIGIISWNCSHLTNFALIINVNQDFNNPYALQLLTYIGCGVSIGSLIVTLFIYLSIKKLRRRLAPRLLICLSISLLLLLAVFVGLVNRTEWEIGCKVIASALQYLLLATFFWMFCEGVNLYRNFVILFKKSHNETHVFVKMSIFAWGMPLVIVLLTAYLRFEDLGSKDICLVGGYGFYFGTLIPAGLVLFFNWVVLFLAMRGMKTDKILHAEKNKKRPVTWVEIWRAFLCSVILGLAWTFGVFAIGDVKDIFQWLFCVFNSFQGLFIFLLFVVRNKEIQKVFYKMFNNGNESSTNSTENLSSPQKKISQSHIGDYKLNTNSVGVVGGGCGGSGGCYATLNTRTSASSL